MGTAYKVIVIGAGPAGLTAAYELSKNKIDTLVLEADPVYVGGMARTVQHKNYSFDIGGHRFFSKSQEIEKLWSEILPNDFLTRKRKSRIYYHQRFFSYPLKLAEALIKLGPIEALRCAISYVKARMFPKKEIKTFEDWVSDRFGDRLYRIFFKSYTEKVWGMPCHQISADWAAQRIKGLSISAILINALSLGAISRRKNIKTYIDSFRYPRKGPGMMWAACADRIGENDGRIEMGIQLTDCRYNNVEKKWTLTYRDKNKQEQSAQAEHLISSIPLRNLCGLLAGSLSESTRKAAENLHYRDFLIVNLILKGRPPFDDQWIYTHDPDIRVGRIQNAQAWSPEMVPDSGTYSLGLEYFCFEGDDLWNQSDQGLLQMAANELEKMDLAHPQDVLDGIVVRQPKAYPVYDQHFSENLALVRRELAEKFPTLSTIGRNGMHKYNNQDHAMMTGLLAARNIISGQEIYDPWRVNIDAEYLEEKHG